MLPTQGWINMTVSTNSCSAFSRNNETTGAPPPYPSVHVNGIPMVSAIPVQQMTTVQKCRIAGYTLSALSAIAGTVGLIASAKKNKNTDFFPLAFGLTAISPAVFLATWSLKDYENPKELSLMRKKAMGMSFEKILQEHKLTKIAQYAVVEPLTLQEKFQDQYSAELLSKVIAKHSFSTIKKYNLAAMPYLRQLLGKELNTTYLENLNWDFLKKCYHEGILPEGLLGNLEVLSNRAQILPATYERIKGEIHQRYPQRTEQLLQNLILKEKKALQESQELKAQMLNNGYAAANSQANKKTAMDMLFTNKGPRTLVLDHIEQQGQGQAVAQQIAQKTADELLKKKYAEITAQKKLIIEQNIGGVDQENYNREILIAKKQYDIARETLQREFKHLVQMYF